VFEGGNALGGATVHGGGDLDDEVEESGEDHHLGVTTRVEADGDADAVLVVGGELGLLGVARLALGVEVDAAAENGQEPRDGEKHDGGAGEGTDTNGDLFLSVVTEAGEQDHHAIRDRTKNGEHDSSHNTGEGRNEQKKFRTIRDKSAGHEKNVAVDRGEEKQLGAIGIARVWEHSVRDAWVSNHLISRAKSKLFCAE